MRKSFLTLFIISALFISACTMISGRGDDVKLARVQNKTLYLSDLEGLLPPATSSSDSAVIIKRYVDNWVRQQIFLKEAEAQLNADQKEINRKVEDYKNSLVIFNYENYLIKNHLDTVITPELMAEYYEKHQDEFKLREHIVKVNFIKLPLDAPDVNLVRRLIRSEEEEDIQALEEYCLNNAASYFLEPESWFLFSDILRDLPVNPQNQENFLRNTRFLERNDEFYRYFLYIRDYRLEGSASPLAFQSDNIRTIILNHRKQNFINEFRQDLFKKALQSGQFEVY